MSAPSSRWATSPSEFWASGWQRAYDKEKHKRVPCCGEETITWKCAGILSRLVDARARAMAEKRWAAARTEEAESKP